MARIRRGRGPNYTAIPWHLQDDPDADASTISTYAALKRYADFGGEEGSRASHKTLAEKAGLGERTLRNRLNRLRKMGWIEWDSGQTTNHYVVHFSRQEMPSGVGTSCQVDSAGDAARTRRVVPTTIPPPTTPPLLPPTAPSPNGAAKDTWMTPYIDLHREILGGSMQVSKWVRAFKSLTDEHGAAVVLVVQRNYLENLRATGRQEFLNYHGMAEAFGTWVAKGTAGRPTQRITGKDYDV